MRTNANRAPYTLNLLTTCVYLSILSLIRESLRTRKDVVPLASLYRLDDRISLCMYMCDRFSCYLDCDFLLCASRSRFHSWTYIARFLVVHGAMLEETSIMYESASVISLRV